MQICLTTIQASFSPDHQSTSAKEKTKLPSADHVVLLLPCPSHPAEVAPNANPFFASTILHPNTFRHWLHDKINDFASSLSLTIVGWGACERVSGHLLH